MQNSEGEDLTRRLAQQCDALSLRLNRAERRTRLLGVMLGLAIALPLLSGALNEQDAIILKDANGIVRILLQATANGPAFIQINSSNGVRRIHLGESDTGVPNLTIYNQDGQTSARAFGP